MAYIGKVEINSNWTKLEDLIKAQVTGQSAFAFDADKKYQIQTESDWGAHLCEVASKPTDANEGFEIEGTQAAHYQPTDAKALYVKTSHGNYGLLKIGVMGE